MPRVPTGIALAFLLSTLALGLSCGRGGGGDLRFSISFRHPVRLSEGDLVLQEGVAVGRVMQVKRTEPAGAIADVKVFKEFRSRMHTGSTFTIRVPHAGLGARPRIEVEVIDPSSEPLTPGHQAKGADEQ